MIIVILSGVIPLPISYDICVVLVTYMYDVSDEQNYSSEFQDINHVNKCAYSQRRKLAFLNITYINLRLESSDSTESWRFDDDEVLARYCSSPLVFYAVLRRS